MGRDTVVNLVSRAIVLVSSLLTSVLLARNLGPAGNGRYAYAILCAGIITTIGGSGLGVANVVFTSSQRYPLEKLVSFSFAAAAVLGLGSIGVVELVLYSVPGERMFGVVSGEIHVAAAAIPLLLVINYLGGILLGKRRFFSYNLLNTTQAVSLLLAAYIAVPLLGQGLAGAIWAWYGATFLSAMVATYLALNIARPAKFGIRLGKDVLAFGLRASLGNILGLLNYRVGVLLLGALMSAKDVGEFVVAIAIAELLLFVPNAISLAMFPRVSTGNDRDANTTTPLICRQTIFLTVLMAAAVALASRSAIQLLYGSAYSGVAEPLNLLLVGMIPLAASKILSTDLTGRGQPLIPTLAAAASLIINLGLLMILVPLYGLTGAAISMSSAYLTDAIIQLLFQLRVSGNSLVHTVLVTRADLTPHCAFGPPLLKRAVAVFRSQ